MINKKILPFIGLIQFCFALNVSAQYSNLNYQSYLENSVPKNVLTFLNENVRYAKAVSAKYNIPEDFLLCVAGLETGWGSSELSVQANNFFGIKNLRSEGPSYCVWHSDYVEGKGLVEAYDCFKKYSSPLMSFLDYMEHIYSKACYLEMLNVNEPSFDDWVSLVSRCGYATDPNYGNKLKEIKQKYYFSVLLRD
jgi:flagellum-specific peptidoglycan hydrolase FlgJ